MKKDKTYTTGDAVITKMRLIREVNCDKCHNFYYEAKWRVYTNSHHFYRGNFVIWFDIFDVHEYFADKDGVTKKDIREYADTIAFTFLCNAPRKNINGETMRPFYAECRESIEHYNGTRAA